MTKGYNSCYTLVIQIQNSCSDHAMQTIFIVTDILFTMVINKMSTVTKSFIQPKLLCGWLAFLLKLIKCIWLDQLKYVSIHQFLEINIHWHQCVTPTLILRYLILSWGITRIPPSIYSRDGRWTTSGGVTRTYLAISIRLVLLCNRGTTSYINI